MFFKRFYDSDLAQASYLLGGQQTGECLASTPSELPQHRDALILDVRNNTEHAEGAIPGARQLHADRLPWKLNDLPRDREIVVHCQGGARSAASVQCHRTGGRLRSLGERIGREKA